MAITYNEATQIFTLQTAGSTYQMMVGRYNILQHLYYGRKDYLLWSSDSGFSGNPYEAGSDRTFSLDIQPQEYPSAGVGDYRTSCIEVVNPDGTRAADFRYVSHEITAGAYKVTGMPAVYDENGESSTLTILMKDTATGLELVLKYGVFEKEDVITRAAELRNTAKGTISLEKMLSVCLDMGFGEWEMIHFHGRHAMERQMERTPLCHGTVSVGSRRGTSSHHHNPSLILCTPQTTEDAGDCYGMAFVYSSNFLAGAEVDQMGQTRVVMGIHPENFCFRLEPGETFETPQVIMSYSGSGFTQLSHNFHRIISDHICRGKYKYARRPILINNWEATYFNFDEEKILKIASQAADLGIEMLVLDDGWFGNRNDDKSSLGDWYADEKKLPGGLLGIAQKIKALGLDFGIWVEPEMVSVNSRLYEKHPDWAAAVPGRNHSEGRNQRILDLANPQVQEFVIEEMSRVFSGADISYVKWDMNRIFSDDYSPYLPPDRQGEAAHRYICGLYHCMDVLTKRFPDILFEGCAAGGNRFDLGILCYFPQIWASDNTDAVSRAQIQNNYTYGYPPSVLSSHVSASPNHQTLRRTPLETRFAVAAFGDLGYECNFCDMSKEELEAVKAQITLYKEKRELFQRGIFYRGRSFSDRDIRDSSVLSAGGGSLMEWSCVKKDTSEAVGLLMNKLAVANTPHTCFYAKGLDPEKQYHFYNRALKYNIKDFGDLVNTASPVHIRQDSLIQHLAAKWIKINGEREDYHVFGDTLMYCGVRLKQAFCATGLNDEVRYFPDFGARLYFMDEEKAR